MIKLYILSCFLGSPKRFVAPLFHVFIASSYMLMVMVSPRVVVGIMLLQMPHLRTIQV